MSYGDMLSWLTYVTCVSQPNAGGQTEVQLNACYDIQCIDNGCLDCNCYDGIDQNANSIRTALDVWSDFWGAPVSGIDEWGGALSSEDLSFLSENGYLSSNIVSSSNTICRDCNCLDAVDNNPNDGIPMNTFAEPTTHMGQSQVRNFQYWFGQRDPHGVFGIDGTIGTLRATKMCGDCPPTIGLTYCDSSYCEGPDGIPFNSENDYDNDGIVGRDDWFILLDPIGLLD